MTGETAFTRYLIQRVSGARGLQPPIIMSTVRSNCCMCGSVLLCCLVGNMPSGISPVSAPPPCHATQQTGSHPPSVSANSYILVAGYNALLVCLSLKRRGRISWVCPVPLLDGLGTPTSVPPRHGFQGSPRLTNPAGLEFRLMSAYLGSMALPNFKYPPGVTLRTPEPLNAQASTPNYARDTS